MSEIHDAIVAREAAFMETFKQGDAAGIAAYYTGGGQLLAPNSDTIEGHDNIQAAWQMFMDMGIKVADLQTVEVDGSGETAYEVGNYVLEGNEGQQLDRGKYMIVWKLEDGAWKLHRDIFNTSMPAQG
jgi:uncharacterized protein (TIGR02246 family)